MKFILAHLRLIRWPNLVFIALTQLLYYYFIVQALVLPGNDEFISSREGWLYMLIAASVLIAAGGYVINDYFDINIDVVNKPERVVVDMIINRRWAMFLHFVFSGAGMLLSLYVSMKVNNIWIMIGNVACVLLLWFYSTSFKKKLLSGNIIISLLTAWVILVLYFFTGGRLVYYGDYPGFHSSYPVDLKKLFLLSLLYAGFAFIISLVREVVKDIEDMEGDDKYGCRTLPLVWGIPAARIFCGVWLTVLIATLLIIAFYAFQSGWWLSAAYIFAAIIIPSIYIWRKLFKATRTEEFRKLSALIKIVMLMGILSMIFIKFLP